MTPEHLALLALLGFALYAASVGTDNAVRNISRGLFGALDDVFSGAVEGVGQVVGVPVTNEARCLTAQKAGNVLDASMYCDAAEFMRFVGRGGKPVFNGGGATGKW